MTAREAAIVSAYTGYLIGSFSEMHAYIDEIMGRPVWTNELGSKIFASEISARAETDFCAIEVTA